MPATCGSCQAEIRWVITVPGGARTPIDPGTRGDPDGDALLFRVGPDVYCVILTAKQAAAGFGLLPVSRFWQYRTHWSTCPHAGQHSKGKAASHAV